MKEVSRWLQPLALALIAGLATQPNQAWAQDDGIVWENATELSFVSTGGNASSNTLGLKAALTGTTGPHQFKIEAGGVRGETSTPFASGTAQAFSVNRDSELSVENYFARGRYDRDLDAAFIFAGAGWDRNTFAGIKNRYAGVAGVGRTWVDGETGHFKTDIGATYTIQKDVEPAPGADDGFGGIRFSLDAARQLSESAEYTSVLVLDENIEETDDLRADWINSIGVTLSESLALKTSLQLLFDNLPSQVAFPLFDTGGTPTGTEVLDTGKKWDNILTVTLVITL